MIEWSGTFLNDLEHSWMIWSILNWFGSLRTKLVISFNQGKINFILPFISDQKKVRCGGGGWLVFVLNKNLVKPWTPSYSHYGSTFQLTEIQFMHFCLHLILSIISISSSALQGQNWSFWTSEPAQLATKLGSVSN